MGLIKLFQVAPDFKLDDFNGQQVNLADYRNRKSVVLIFNRGFS
jgi:peroxiredoxin